MEKKDGERDLNYEGGRVKKVQKDLNSRLEGERHWRSQDCEPQQ